MQRVNGMLRTGSSMPELESPGPQPIRRAERQPSEVGSGPGVRRESDPANTSRRIEKAARRIGLAVQGFDVSVDATHPLSLPGVANKPPRLPSVGVGRERWGA